jgi:hypothetical protein
LVEAAQEVSAASAAVVAEAVAAVEFVSPRLM